VRQVSASGATQAPVAPRNFVCADEQELHDASRDSAVSAGFRTTTTPWQVFGHCGTTNGSVGFSGVSQPITATRCSTSPCAKAVPQLPRPLRPR
jgi:hypothetical protein